MKNVLFKLGLLFVYMLPVSVVIVIMTLAKPEVDYCGECVDWTSSYSVMAYINIAICIYAGAFMGFLALKTGNSYDNDMAITDLSPCEYDYIPTMATLLAFASLDYSGTRGVAAFFVLLSFLFLILLKTPFCYSSPILPILGFRVYKGMAGNNELVIISRKCIAGQQCSCGYLKITQNIIYLLKIL